MTQVPEFSGPSRSSDPRYVYADQPDQAELARLRLLERRADPYTNDLLHRRVGVALGWHCLEVGAGAGSVARSLAERVRPTGRVVALDMDTRFLRLPDAATDGVEIWEDDILTAAVPVEAFDLVHTRHLLAHLGAHADGAVRRMVSALRPGGWLVVEDIDVIDVVLSTADPATQEAIEVVMAAFRHAIAVRGADPHIGRRLPVLLESAGLTDVEVDARLEFRRGGQPDDVALATLAALRPVLARSGVADDIIDKVLAALADPAHRGFDVLQVAAWGRVPLADGRAG